MAYANAMKETRMNELIGALNHVLETGDCLGEMEERRLEKDARKLMEADVSGAHTILGALAAARGDLENVHRYHRIAIQQPGGSSLFKLHYVTSLTAVGDLVGASDEAEEIGKQSPQDEYVLSQVIWNCLWGLKWPQAIEWHKMRRKLDPKKIWPQEHLLDAVNLALERKQVHEEALRQLMETAWNVRRKSQHCITKEHDLQWGREDGGFFYRLRLWATPEQAVEMNEQFAEQIPDSAEDHASTFVFMFVGSK